MSQNKNNTSQTIWTAIGSFTSFATTILTVAILSRYLNKYEYGTYKQIVYIYTTLLVVFSAGLPHVFSYFLPKNDIKYGRNIVIKITKILSLSGIVLSVILFLCSGLIANLLNNQALSIGLKYFSPVPSLLLPTLGIEGIFSTYRKTKYIALFNIITRLFMLLCIVFPVIFFQQSYKIAILGWLVSSIFSLIIAIHFKKIPYRGIINVKIKLSYREILKYSIPIATASVWGIAIKASDQFYISRFFGPEIFAEFSNGFIELPIVTMVTASTATVLMPLFTKMIKNNVPTNKISMLWSNAILKCAYIIYPMLIYFIFYAKSIIIVLYSDVYLSSAIYFQIAMAANFFNIVIFAPLIFAMGETKFYSNIHLMFALLIWVLGYTSIIIFNSPIIIAVISVFISIIKVIVFVNFILNKLNVDLLDLFHLKEFFLIIVHSLAVIFFVNFLLTTLAVNSDSLYSLSFSFVIFISLIVFTGSFLNLKYLNFLKQLLSQFQKKY